METKDHYPQITDAVKQWFKKTCHRETNRFISLRKGAALCPGQRYPRLFFGDFLSLLQKWL
jgi:hypothetical protein